MLFGSSILAPTLYVEGKEIQLGEFVRRAYNDSGLSVEEWNNLPDLEREGKIAEAIYTMRAEARTKVTVIIPR